VSRVAAVGLLTGWGEGVQSLPEDAVTAAAGRQVVEIGRPRIEGERFRRATRECLLGVAAVEAMLADGGLARTAIAGEATALVYVTAAAYGAANRNFVDGATGATLHFPYTAPSAVPAEVAIEFSLRGPYLIFVGGAAATLDALSSADRLLAQGRAARALVLAVETFAECADLYGRGRWLTRRPLVEASACAMLVADGARAHREVTVSPSPLETRAARRAGETLACAPLVAAALARLGGEDRPTLTGRWRQRRTALALRGAEVRAG
jgi:3-oxoacyl-(acyl-carrier-protein) synthase